MSPTPENPPQDSSSSSGSKIEQNPFPIVGVGASAGGLEAFTQLLSHLPPDTGMAFVLVQHLSPDHPSQLAALLGRITPMQVFEVEDGMGLLPNQIYVIPPNANMELSRGKLKLTPRGPDRTAHSVDHFFCSLAAEHEHCAIGIILSGTGSDGTVGLTEIKAAGGITFAQDEKTARFSGMPAHARHDSVDFILPPEQIAQELARIGKDPYLGLSDKGMEAGTEAQEAKDFRRILFLLNSHTGVDLSQYRDTTIKRRIQRRMVVRTRHSLADYVQLLEKERNELDFLLSDVLISVTSFFREPEMFDLLKSHIFPEILKSSPPVVRVWVPGCSTGQEAYSIAIALQEFLEQKALTAGIQIFATDVNEATIEKGRRGYYTDNIETQMSAERLRRFFTKEDGGYRISKAIRDVCVFAQQNVTSDPPFSRMDMVTCRNLLIYFTPALQRQVISTFHYALNASGYLVLGNSESVGNNSDLFETVDRKHKVFSKKGAAIRPFSHFTAQDLKSRVPLGHYNPLTAASTPADFQKEADKVLLGRFAPAGVLINGDLEVLQFRGRTGPYLEPPVGEASFNLLKMARENLALELGTAVREAKKTGVPVRRNVRLDDQDVVRKVDLEVIPLKLPGSAENCFLILFEEAQKEEASVVLASKGTKVAGEKMAGDKNDDELKQLRRDLTAAREYLQAIIEQQEAAHEELKCANEEVLSSNEELQSTNEQLGTAKEELQSTNEELQTLNEELQTRNVDLNQLNNDLSNLLESQRIPILMVGNDLRVRRVNPAAIELLQLKPAMIGRPVISLESSLIPPQTEKLLLEVIDKVSVREIEVRDRHGHWYSLRLNPYRTADNRIEGAVMALVDITQLKSLQEIQKASAQIALSESEDRFRMVADSAPVLIWLCDQDKRYTWFNKPWLEFTGRTMEQELGDGWRENVHPEDLPRILQVSAGEFDARRGFQMEYRLRRHDGRYRWLLNQGVPRARGTEFVGYIGSCIDITERKKGEKKLEESLLREKKAREAAELANNAKDRFLAALSHELRTPLNPVLLIASDAAKDPQLPESVRGQFETVRKNVELEARLIDDLLDLTRIATGKVNLNLEMIDAQTILQDALANVRTEMVEKNIDVTLKTISQPLSVWGDAVRLQQIFWNLLSNAVKFTPRGGKILVETFLNDDFVGIRIADNGIGLTSEELARVFSAFSQGDHAAGSHPFGGLGLGLAISRHLAELHSGRLAASSEGRNKGAIFLVELPRAEPGKARRLSNPNQPENNTSGSKLEPAGPSILLVEDHEATRNTLAHLLTRRHYNIHPTASIAEAKEIAAREKIDFVISDIGLPDGSGYDLMKELSRGYGLRGIALTGYGMEEDIGHSLESGFITHLTKPIKIQDLEKHMGYRRIDSDLP